MEKEDRSKATSAEAKTTDEMVTEITCGQCGKTNGSEQVGTSWICSDCKVTENV